MDRSNRPNGPNGLNGQNGQNGQNKQKWIMEDQIGFIAYGAALMIEIIFQSCFLY